VNATSSTILDPFTLAGIAGTALIIVAYSPISKAGSRQMIGSIRSPI
jgi:hypothetical protein